MIYPPPHHQDDDKAKMLSVIKTYPLAILISIDNNKPLITHLPLVYRESDEKLIGHIDIYNPQTLLLRDNKPVTIIFTGPDCYISPSVYGTDQLPTYNYIKVHLKGTVNAIENRESLKASLITMTEFLEAPNPKYVLKPDNPKMERALDYIRMFEISITSWEGKFKLSQDKRKTDTNLAKDELIRANKQSIKDFLDSII